MKSAIERIVRGAACAPVLLVASDFDGVLAPIVNDPAKAQADPEAIEHLERIGRMPHTQVAVISGRGMEDLRSKLPGLTTAWFAGSHGAEMEGERPGEIAAYTRESLDAVTELLERIAKRTKGVRIEYKPRAVAFHYRELSDALVGPTVESVLKLKPSFPALTVRLGSAVIEFVVDTITKGDALRYIRHRTGAAVTIFVGDDLTDEHAFAELQPPDMSVKVGAGNTRAHNRLESASLIAELYRELANAREDWLRDRVVVPIQDHAVLSDQRTLALIAPRARLTWLCLPRIDSPALFAELLGGPSAGFFQIAPVEDAGPGVQSYCGDTMISCTKWPMCTVTDYLDCGGGRAFQRAGRTDFVRAVEGSGVVKIQFAPRLDFGRVGTQLLQRDGILEVMGAHDPVVLHGPELNWKITNEGSHQTAEAEYDLANGPLVLDLRYGSGSAKAHLQTETERRQATHGFWNSWAASLKLPAVEPALVRRSALMLRALCYGPSGAIAAAGTTGLPEHLGGVRNWDYRYCWPRDASLAALALLRLGNTGTAMRLLDWLQGVLERIESPDRLHPIYTVSGNTLGSEAEIGSLAGYGNSRPVRIGNAAAQQVQLDVFGPITDMVASLAERGAPISPDHWRITRAMVEAVEARWMEPDHGIWEIRGPTRHHVHSRAMCFHTVDRAMVVHEHVLGRPNSSWRGLREQIREDVLTHGFNEAAGSFTAYYGATELDAASLSVGLVGLVETTDPRFTRTVEAVEKGLLRGHVVDRYRYEDGLPGREGGFHLCTSWLIEALVKLGRIEDARVLFDALAALVGPTGALAEQYDPGLGIALGNVPQAYSHIALINSAMVLAEKGHGVDAMRNAHLRETAKAVS